MLLTLRQREGGNIKEGGRARACTSLFLCVLVHLGVFQPITTRSTAISSQEVAPVADVEIVDATEIREQLQEWDRDQDSQALENALKASLARVDHSRAIQVASAYATCGSIRAACEAAGVSPASHYRWLREVEGYEEAITLAREMLLGIAEGELFRRAVWGREVDVWYGGEVVGQKREWSDRLLERLLKALDPDRYSDRKQITGADGGPVEISFVDPRDAGGS